MITLEKEPQIIIPKGSDIFRAGFREGVQPIPDQLPWQWADDNVWLAGEAAAEPGRYRSSRTPYVREILEELGPKSPVTTVVAMMGTQISKTMTGMIAQGYYVHRAPCPMASYLPRKEDTSNHSKLKWTPMVKATPVLYERIIEGASREDNTVFTKIFPGGIHKFLNAETEASFAHMSYKIIHASEIKSWPDDIEGQGDPTMLLPKRLDAFSDKGAKLYLESSPTIHKLCKIERWFLNSDQSYYFVPCPLCGHYQTFKWPNIHYERDDNYNLIGDPMYECEKCNRLFGEDHKEEIMAHGVAEWRPSVPEITDIRGFHLNSFYSPFVSWNIIVKEWILANKEKDRNQIKVYFNTRLAETWKEDVEVQDATRLASHREKYEADIPAGAAIVLLSVDVQADRLELEVKGWGPGKESWGIEHKIIHGEFKNKQTKQDLDDFFFNTVYKHELGIDMKIYAMAIDSGFETKRVYEYVRKHRGKRIFPIKGKGGDYVPLKKSKDKTNNITLNLIGTNAMKETVIGWLSEDEPGPGYCHFSESYSLAFFDQFENFYVTTKNGRREFLDKPGKPVESIDLFVYNHALLDILNVDLDREYSNMLIRTKAIKEGTPIPSTRKVRRVRVKRPGA